MIMEKNEGKVFEKDFQDSYPIGVFIYRLKDTASTFTGGKNTKYTTYNMCDYIAFNPEHKCVLALELKSFKGKSMPFTNIKSHQLTDMKKAKDEQNIESYFVLNFSSAFWAKFCFCRNFVPAFLANPSTAKFFATFTAELCRFFVFGFAC